MADKNYLDLSQKELYPHFLSIIKDKTDDSEVRRNTLITLKGFRTQELVNLEMKIAADTKEDEGLRSAAVINLGVTKEKKAVDLLIRLLDDVSEKVNREAVHSLGNIGDSKAIQYLFPLLNRGGENQELLLKAAVRNAIKKLQAKEE